MPPDGELTTPAPHDRNIHREHEQPERDHPEADDGKEADEAEGDQQNAEADADRLRLRQMEMTIGEADLGGHARTFMVGSHIRTIKDRRNQPFSAGAPQNGDP